MRLNAYVLAGDPAWATQSLRSYYPLVERVFVSFDRNHRSWAGRPLAVNDTLAALRSADPEGKIRVVSGDYCAPELPLYEAETIQRQAALDQAAESADWVLQFDSDEILLSRSVFMSHVTEANRRGADAVEYPLRNFYVQTGTTRFLERCGRFWNAQASYPGPLAVRSSVALAHCRQARVPTYRVDLRPWSTDPSHAGDTRVHAVIRPGDAVVHLSWVRTAEQMRAKAQVSGYAPEVDWDRAIRQWEWASRHPWLMTARSPLMPGAFSHFRLATLDV